MAKQQQLKGKAMPRLSCYFVRASLLYLAIGGLIGGFILSAKGMPQFFGWSWQLLVSHIQIMVVGWLVQFALGVAYWILPRHDSQGERGRTYAAWLSFGSLNLGVLGSAVLFPLRSAYDAPWLDIGLILAAMLLVFSLVAFAWHAWPRIAPLVTGSRTSSHRPV